MGVHRRLDLSATIAVNQESVVFDRDLVLLWVTSGVQVQAPQRQGPEGLASPTDPQGQAHHVPRASGAQQVQSPRRLQTAQPTIDP